MERQISSFLFESYDEYSVWLQYHCSQVNVLRFNIKLYFAVAGSIIYVILGK